MQFRRLAILATTISISASGLLSPVPHAQEAKRPVGIVSISPLDKFLDHANYILRASNVPEMGGLVTMLANQYTQGIDRAKPLGVTMLLDDDQNPNATIFLPLTNRQALFGALAGMGIEPDDLGGGLYEINASGQAIYAKESNGWMFVAQTENALANVPADPSTALGKLPDNYDLAFRINVQALPADLKDWASEQMRIGFERSMAEQAGQTEVEKENARAMGEAQIAQIEQMIEETDEVVIGWNADPAAQKVYIDIAAKFVEGTKLATQVAAMNNLTSSFTTFAIPNSAARFRLTSKIAEEDKALQIENLRNSAMQIKAQQQQLDIPPETKQMLEEFTEGLIKIAEQTIQEGTFDGAGSLSLADDTLRGIIGGKIADGKALAAEVKKIAGSISSGNASAPRFEFDYATYKSMDLHKVTVPVQTSNPETKKVLGDSLNINIATGEKAFVIALDPAGDEALKAAIDRLQSGQAAPTTPFEAIVEVGQLLRFAQAVSPNAMIDNALQAVQKASGKDKVEITGRMIERGGMYRIAVEEGVLKAAGALNAGGQNGGF